MKTRSSVRKTLVVAAASIVASVLSAFGGQAPGRRAAPAESKLWTDTFDTSACTWSATGRNDFFILEPGDQGVFDSREGKDAVRLVITVSSDTKRVGSVDTRIVEERESRNGQLVEVSRNFFALCGPTSDVFYFGEDVDIYKNGKLDNHEGSWMAGQAGAKPGLFMPARPLVGARFYQEIAPGVAMDRVEIVSLSETVKTPMREFRESVKTEETTPLEPGVKDYKVYARGIGMIQDGSLLLTTHGSVASQK